jgi:hypothetical protein
MRNNTYSRPSQMVSTVKQSQATIPWLVGAGMPATMWLSAAVPDRAGGGAASCGSRLPRPARPAEAARLGYAGSPSADSPWPSARSAPARPHPAAVALVREDTSTRRRPSDGASAAGLRLDKEAGPARSGQHAADRSQQGTVGGLEPGPWDLAAQHQEFQVSGDIAAGQECEQLDRAAQREVGEPCKHPHGLQVAAAEAQPCRAHVL